MAKKQAPPDNDLNANQMVPAALKWLYEMEAVNSPALLNNLYGNVYAYPNIEDAEILIDRFNKRMLILVQFNWLTRKIFKKRKKETIMNLLDQLQELLPSFSFRIIEDRALFDLSLKRWTETNLGGKKNEKPNESSVADASPSVAPASSEPNGEPQPIAVGSPVEPTPNVVDESPTPSFETDSKKPSES